MKNTNQITEADEKWLRNGVISALIQKHRYEKHDAEKLYDESPLLEILHDDPDDIFRHGTSYWANFLIEVTDWNPFEDFSHGDYDSKDDSEFQEMKASFKNLSEAEQVKYKKDYYDWMLEDENIGREDTV